MSPLRERMMDAMQVRGLAERTQQAYVTAVAALARHYHTSPELLDQVQVCDYLLYLSRDRHLARSSVIQAGCAFRFLYYKVLQRPQEFRVPLAKSQQKLPEILSREELARLFACAGEGKARVVLMTAYGLGLRVSELCHLRVKDVDGHADRMCVRVVQGKGAKDRYVPMPQDVRDLLRAWWRNARPSEWLFAAQTDAGRPLCEDSASRWYHAARSRAGIVKQGGIHTLRHCYATHMLEAGVDLHSLSHWLGHRHVGTTMRYLHLARPDAPDGIRRAPLELLRAVQERPH
jgi:site-specific recombinase XerD